MKKILLLILMIPFGVNASEYSDYKEYDETVVSENILKVQKHKYYRIEKEYGPYELEEIQNEIYPLISYENYIYSDYSDWTNEILEKDYIEKTFYKYSTVSDTNQIIFSGFSNHYNYVDITGLEVLYDGKEIPFEAEYFLCKNVIEDLKENGIARVRKNSRITLNLDDEYETKKIYIKLSYISSEVYPTSITLEHKNNDLINASKQYIKIQAEGETFIESSNDNLNIKNTNKIIYKEEKISDGDLFLGEEIFYKYRDKLYLKYRENKVYTDYLFSNPDSLIYFKDDDYKIYYKELESSVEINENIDNTQEIENEQEEKVVISNPVKTTSSQKKLADEPEKIIYEDSQKNEENTLNIPSEKEKDYSFLYLFLVIPILFIIKIILVLSKSYKEKKKHAIV